MLLLQAGLFLPAISILFLLLYTDRDKAGAAEEADNGPATPESSDLSSDSDA